MFWTRWNPLGDHGWNRFQRFQNDMVRLLDRWGDGNRFAAFPALNVWEEDEALHVEAELPGMNLDEVEIFVTGKNQLTIKGERNAPVVEKGVQHRQERGFGQFVRTLTLPYPVDEEQVDARLENGILTIKLPKHAAAKPRRIAVKA